MNAIKYIDSKRTLFFLGWMMLLGVGTLQIQPVLGGALVDHWGVSLQQIGMLFGIELIAMAVGCLGAALTANRIDRRKLCQAGLLILAAGNLMSAFHPDGDLLSLSRFIAGLGGGMMQGIVYATTVMRSNKDRTYAFTNAILLIWGAFTIAIVPKLLVMIGISGVFLTFPVMVLLSLPFTRLIPRSVVMVPTQTAALTGMSLKSILLLVLFALLFGGHGVLWVYQERIGNLLGLDGSSIGAILGLSVLSGAVGAMLAGLIGRRISVLTSQLLGFAGSIVASLVIVYGHSALAYASAACIVMAVWFFGLTYLLAYLAELDPSGRLSGLANSSILIGQGLGPIAAAMTISSGNFRAVGWLASSIYLICIVIALYAIPGRSKNHDATIFSKQPTA